MRWAALPSTDLVYFKDVFKFQKFKNVWGIKKWVVFPYCYLWFWTCNIYWNTFVTEHLGGSGDWSSDSWFSRGHDVRVMRCSPCQALPWAWNLRKILPLPLPFSTPSLSLSNIYVCHILCYGDYFMLFSTNNLIVLLKNSKLLYGINLNIFNFIIYIIIYNIYFIIYTL